MSRNPSRKFKRSRHFTWDYACTKCEGYGILEPYSGGFTSRCYECEGTGSRARQAARIISGELQDLDWQTRGYTGKWKFVMEESAKSPKLPLCAKPPESSQD